MKEFLLKNLFLYERIIAPIVYSFGLVTIWFLCYGKMIIEIFLISVVLMFLNRLRVNKKIITRFETNNDIIEVFYLTGFRYDIEKSLSFNPSQESEFEFNTTGYWPYKKVSLKLLGPDGLYLKTSLHVGDVYLFESLVFSVLKSKHQLDMR